MERLHYFFLIFLLILIYYAPLVFISLIIELT